MNKIIKGMLTALGLLALAGCGSVFHNGTEMAVKTVRVENLPSTPFKADTVLVFSQCYNIAANSWVHDDSNKLKDPYWRGTVDSKGTLTINFNPPLIVEESQLKFLLIDPDKNWAVYKSAMKAAVDLGNPDVILDNTWAGKDKPVTLVGKVQNTSDKDIVWNFE